MKRPGLVLSWLAAHALAACNRGSGVEADSGPDADGDGDSDTDSDTDGDGDTDTGSEIDTNCFDFCEDDDVGESVDASMWTKVDLEPEIYCHFGFDNYAKMVQEYICQEQTGLDCFLPPGTQNFLGLVIITSEEALEPLGPWWGDVCVDLLDGVDWESEKVIYGWARMSDQLPSTQKDYRFYENENEALQANLFIWNPPADIQIDQQLQHGIMLVLDSDQEITTCLHKHAPCDGL
jgi:hypothetical protein